jgi:hypothetical protein
MYEEFVEFVDGYTDPQELKDRVLAFHHQRRDYRMMMERLSGDLPCVMECVTLPDDVSMAVLGEYHKKVSLKCAVMILNDLAGWSREKIADWLDNIHDGGTLDLSFAGKSQEDCQVSD